MTTLARIAILADRLAIPMLSLRPWINKSPVRLTDSVRQRHRRTRTAMPERPYPAAQKRHQFYFSAKMAFEVASGEHHVLVVCT
jgi:hypothetical protein